MSIIKQNTSYNPLKDMTLHNTELCAERKKVKACHRPLRTNDGNEGHSQTQPGSNMSPRQQQ